MSETQWDALLREPLSDRCSENIRRFSRLYGLPRNRDLVIRPFLAGCVECVLMYLQGMASERVIGRFILTPLMECDTLSGEPLPAIRKRLAIPVVGYRPPVEGGIGCRRFAVGIGHNLTDYIAWLNLGAALRRDH